MQVSVSHDFLPKQPSVRSSQVMDHFGITFEQGRHIIAEGLQLPIEPGQVVLFTGASGSGKSSLMRAAAGELARMSIGVTESLLDPDKETREPDDKRTALIATADAPGPPVALSPCRDESLSKPAKALVLNLDDLQLPATLLVDALNLPAAEAMNLLSTCGLGEAHLMLRTPAELSDGQRYRFRLALALSQSPQWVVADEFTATLDRTLAKVIAYNIRRLAARTGVGFLLATTHEDVTHDLAPDVHIRCRLDGEIQVTRANANPADADQPAANKKKVPSPSPATSGSPPRPATTGRISLGGITAATISASPAS
jgi:hypothetical protein